MSQNKNVNISLFGCLPFLLGCLLLGGLGACGKGCQKQVLGGIQDIRAAVTGEDGPKDGGQEGEGE